MGAAERMRDFHPLHSDSHVHLSEISEHLGTMHEARCHLGKVDPWTMPSASSRGADSPSASGQDLSVLRTTRALQRPPSPHPPPASPMQSHDRHTRNLALGPSEAIYSPRFSEQSCHQVQPHFRPEPDLRRQDCLMTSSRAVSDAQLPEDGSREGQEHRSAFGRRVQIRNAASESCIVDVDDEAHDELHSEAKGTRSRLPTRVCQNGQENLPGQKSHGPHPLGQLPQTPPHNATGPMRATKPPSSAVSQRSPSVRSRASLRSPDEELVFTPSYATYTPSRDVHKISYKCPEKRQRGVLAAPSTVTRPNIEDALRRVSVVLHKHITTCETRLKIATIREARLQVSRERLSPGSLTSSSHSTDTDDEGHSQRSGASGRHETFAEGSQTRNKGLTGLLGRIWNSSLFLSRTRQRARTGGQHERRAHRGSGIFPIQQKEGANGMTETREMGRELSIAGVKEVDKRPSGAGDRQGQETLKHRKARSASQTDGESDGDADVDADTEEARDALHEQADREYWLERQAMTLFREDAFVIPKYLYKFVRVPIARPGICYSMKKVKVAYHIPTAEEIYTFMGTLFRRACLSSECPIVCLIYIERLMETAHVPLTAITWRPIALCGLLLASKVWQDLSSWNVEFSAIYPQYSIQSINKLERVFITTLRWDLYICSSLYAKYYFALRALYEKRDFRRRYNMCLAVNPPRADEISARTGTVSEDLREMLSRSV